MRDRGTAELAGGEGWVASQPATSDVAQEASAFCFDLVELRLGDGAAVEQGLGVGDLTGRIAGGRRGDGLDAGRLSRVHLLGLLQLTLLHPVPAGDQVDQDAQARPRDDDHRDHPDGLGTSGQVLAPEDVSQDPGQAHEPGEEQEELKESKQERTVVRSVRGWRSLLTRVEVDAGQSLGLTTSTQRHGD